MNNINDDDINIINIYISKLRKIGIKCDIKVFQDETEYVIYLTDKNEDIKYDEEMSVLFYDLNKENLDKLSKNILSDYLFSFYSDIKDYDNIKNSKFAILQEDITEYFNDTKTIDTQYILEATKCLSDMLLTGTQYRKLINPLSDIGFTSIQYILEATKCLSDMSLTSIQYMELINPLSGVALMGNQHIELINPLSGVVLMGNQHIELISPLFETSFKDVC